MKEDNVYERIRYDGKVHYFDSIYGGTLCNHISIENSEYELTEDDVECERCVDISEAYSNAADKMAEEIDERILQLLLKGA